MSMPLVAGRIEDDMKTDYRRNRHFRMLCHCARNNGTRGQTLVEYVLIIVVISLVLITAMRFFQGRVSSTYNNAASSISQPP